MEKGGLGALLPYLGGGWYTTPRGCISYKARIKPLCGIKHTRRCNCKQQKRKRLISHYIACKTDVSHISGKIHVRQKTQNATEQPEDGADVCVRAYLNPHITCRLSTLLHVTPYHATIIRRHSAPLHRHTPTPRRINPTWERCTIHYTTTHDIYTALHLIQAIHIHHGRKPHKTRIFTLVYPYFVKI